jgi:hypothetical protein
MVAVDAEWLVEATEYRKLATDRNGGVYHRRIVEAVADDHLDRIVVRRPIGVVHSAVVAAAERFLREQPVYSSSGLMFKSVLVGLGGGWSERTAELFVGDETEDAIEAYLAEIVADGPARLVCAELVYRVLHDAHVELAHEDLLLRDAICHVRALPVPLDYPDAQPRTTADRLATAFELAGREPEPIGSPPEIGRLGWARYLRLVSRQVRDAYERRRSETGDGDVADLVTPRDFLMMQPFETLADLTRTASGWSRAGSAST